MLAKLGLEDVGCEERLAVVTGVLSLLVSKLTTKLDKSCGVQVNNGLERALSGVLERLLVLTVDKLKECGEHLSPAGDRNDVLGDLVVCERLVLGNSLNELKVVSSNHRTSQADDTVGNSGGDEHGLADLLLGTGKVANNFVEFSLKTSIEHSVGLVKNKSSQVGGIDTTVRV